MEIVIAGVSVLAVMVILVILTVIAEHKFKIESYTNYNCGWMVAYKLGAVRVRNLDVFGLGLGVITHKKLKVRVKERNGVFYPQIKFCYGLWRDIEVVRYGDLDDDLVHVHYDNRKDAENYCRNVVGHGAVKDSSKEIFAETSHGDLF